jgi:WD40 repeat protein
MQVHAFGQSSEGHFEHNGSTGTRRRGDDIGRDFAGGRHGTTDEIFHDKYITCLLPIPDMKLIASAGRDKKMCLWEMETLKGKSVHAGPHGHTMAINSLEWYEDSRLILSAGMDHDIFIWNPIVKERIFKLQGHTHALVGVKHLKGTNQIVSADISGMVKVWDVRTFTPIQSFNCPPLNEVKAFSLAWPPKRIVAAGRSMKIFDYEEPTNNHLADDSPAIGVLYNPVFYTFITAHAKAIKIWDATTGAFKTKFRGGNNIAMLGDITCMCLDDRKRKLFFGTSRGKLRTLNAKNGAISRKFRKE